MSFGTIPLSLDDKLDGFVLLSMYEKLESENAKLRELVRDMRPFVKEGWVHACPNRECCLFEECDADSEYECLIEEHMVGRMRELGVEVK